MTKKRVRQYGSKCRGKDDRVGQATMPQHMLGGDPELETDHIQVWNDRARDARKYQGW